MSCRSWVYSYVSEEISVSDVVGIRFKSCGKIYDFETDGLDLKKGDAVVVESELGLSIGSVVIEGHPPASTSKELKRVLRKAGEEDVRQKTDNEVLEGDARAYCLERIMARGLPMKLICTEVTLDRKRIIFYFAAEGRIDFRELVKDLAARFKTRIEMRQIGVRDEAKMLGGLGICGRELCCKKFLTTFEPISIKMAKSQELVLNASKLSGVCGRLMCCLSYEYDGDEDNLIRGENVSVTPEAEKVLSDMSDMTEKPVAPAGDGPDESDENQEEDTSLREPRSDAPEDKRSEAVPAEGEQGLPGKTKGAAEARVSGQGTPEGEKKFRKRRRRHRRRRH
jgi:cell fate regulator YaaT (PSP1 superfamily)